MSDATERLDTLRQCRGRSTSRQHESQLGTLAPQPCECLEQALVVLVRPAAGGIEQERLARYRRRAQVRVVEAEGHHPDPRRVDSQLLDRSAPHELADHDHPVGRAHRAVPGNPPERALAAWEHRRQVEVLEIVQRDDARRPHCRDADRRGKVDDRRRREPPPEAARPDGGFGHREEPLRHRACEAVISGDLGWQPLARVGGGRRQQHAIVELADASE
jgi:hypothetical protein